MANKTVPTDLEIEAALMLEKEKAEAKAREVALQASFQSGLLDNKSITGLPEATPEPADTEISVLSPDGQRYIRKKVTKTEAEAIRVEQMVDRAYLSHEGQVMDTSGYDRSMTHYWTHENPTGLSSTEARQKGYRPVDPKTCGPLMPGHMVRTIPGWDGPVVTAGDLVLMEIPNGMKRANDLVERRQSEALRNPDLVGRGESILSELGIDDENSGVLMERGGRQMTHSSRTFEQIGGDGGDDFSEGGVYDSMERSQAMADSHRRAMAWKERRERESSGGRRTYGGFDGPANNGAIKNSRMNIVGRPER